MYSLPLSPSLIYAALSLVVIPQKLWQSGEAMEIVGPLRVVHQYVNMPEQTAEFLNETTGKLEEVSTRRNIIVERKADSREREKNLRAVLPTGARLHTRDGLQLRGRHHRWTGFVFLRAGNNDGQSSVECHKKFPGCPDRQRHSMPRGETHPVGHRTGESILFVFLFLGRCRKMHHRHHPRG